MAADFISRGIDDARYPVHHQGSLFMLIPDNRDGGVLIGLPGWKHEQAVQGGGNEFSPANFNSRGERPRVEMIRAVKPGDFENEGGFQSNDHPSGLNDEKAFGFRVERVKCIGGNGRFGDSRRCIENRFQGLGFPHFSSCCVHLWDPLIGNSVSKFHGSYL